jgi:hypothetical protein
MLIKFKKNYIKFSKLGTSRLYTDETDNDNVFLRALIDLFTDFGSIVWFREDLLDQASMGTSGEVIEFALEAAVVMFKPRYPHASGPTDYRVKTDRQTLLRLADEWESLVNQQVPSFYIMCINGEYYMREQLPQDIEQLNNILETSITFTQKYIELTKNNDKYVIQENGNYFLMRLAMLFNDNGPSTDWFKDILFAGTNTTIEGTLTQLAINQNMVTMQPSAATADYINNCPIEVDQADLIRLTQEWNSLVQKKAEQVFIIDEDSRYEVVEQLPESIPYHIKGKCFCDACDDY